MNDLINYLLNYALEHHIGVTTTHQLDSHTPSCAFGKSREILINMEWYKQRELAFSIAHEIGHLLNGDDGTNYFSSAPAQSKSEFAANKTAVDILLNYANQHDWSFNNSMKFCNTFGIPEHLEYVAALEMKG